MRFGPRFARLALALASAAGGAAASCTPERPSIDERAELRPPEAAKEAKPERSKPRGELIAYTIQHGGTLIDVANLYQLHHHEILLLNPDLEPRKPLPIGTRVVVYEETGQDSESIGLPHDGALTGAMPLPDGPGRRITAARSKTWGTRHTIVAIDRVLTAWGRRSRKAPPILVSNLSQRQGGPLAPHKTHQSGRDVDLGYIPKQDPDVWQQHTAKTLDAGATWQLLQLLVEQADVEVIFIDRRLQRALLDHALAHGTIPRARLAHWLEVAKGKRDGGPIIKHSPGHADHFHVRLRCTAAEPRCRS